MTRVGWLDVAEVGGVLGIRILVSVTTLMGRTPARALLRVVALYYILFKATARRASRIWLEKVYGPDGVTFGMTYNHILRFAQVSLDRLFFARRQIGRFEMRLHGQEHLSALRTAKTGAILLGAHLGSFEAMRALAELDSVPVNVLGHFRNARMINAALERLDPGSRTRLIEIERGSIEFIFSVGERIGRGEHLAILGDRTGLGGETAEVEFMGARAIFPTGVYLLAHALRCPVYLMFALYREPNRYDIHCELFSERIVLPRRSRADAIAGQARRYADRLAYYSRLVPDNWFNFYDFWLPAEE